MPRLALILWLLLGAGSLYAETSSADTTNTAIDGAIDSADSFWLPVSYREWLGEMRDEAKALQQSNPECQQVIRAALQENQSTIEHPVFRFICRDANNASFSVLVDALSHEQTYANPARSVGYQVQKDGADAPLTDAERLLLDQQAVAERQAAEARLQGQRLQCEQEFQKQIRFMHKFTWLGDGFGELQQLLLPAKVIPVAAVVTEPVSAELAPPVAKLTAQQKEQQEEQPEKPQTEEQIQRRIEQAEQAAKVASAKAQPPAASVAVSPTASAAVSPVTAKVAVTKSVAALSDLSTASTTVSATEPDTAPRNPSKVSKMWFIEGNFDAEDPYGTPLKYQVRCTIPDDGEDVVVKISARRAPAKP